MSGFNEDIVSILKHNTLFNRVSVGWIIGDMNLLDYLYSLKLSVTGISKGMNRFDYIIISEEYINTRRLLRVLTDIDNGGIIILQLGNKVEEFEPVYRNLANKFFATKVKYDNRYYLVIHQGEDYGD
jgi:hypothetical protein